ncbi:MAG: transglycosylase domain-containing protein [Saprospiraceae bacterium]
MLDFKKLITKSFWAHQWQTLKVVLYPYLRPAILRYRGFATRHPKLAKPLLISALAAVLGLFAVLFFLSLIYFGFFGKLPSKADLQDINQNIASEVYSADSVLLGKYYIENRLPADLENVSPAIINALVATEDARFFEHGGIDFRAWIRVFLRTILMQDESAGGGSTISQQLAKNLYPRKRFGKLTVPIAKIKEMFIANRLESAYSKNEILALYLNTVPFGDNVFGIKVAAQRFFDATPENIKVEEAAVLIGMLKANTAYNPARNPQRAQERRNVVMAQMVKYNYLDTLAFDSLKQLPIILKYNTESHNEGIGTYFREHLRLELEDLLKNQTKPDGRPYNLYTDGLKIYTTINSKMQQYAEEAVNQHMKDLQKIFIDHFKGYSNAVPWGTDDLLQQTKRGSERYKILKEKGLSEADIDSSFAIPVNMTIFTWDTTSYEKDTLLSPLDSLKYYLTLLKTGMLAAEPSTGKVLAWVGGINFKYFQYDHVKSKRQVGSTFKPIVYAKALESGISPCERFQNEQITFADGYTPRNSDGSYGGSYSMQGGLRLSVNMVAMQLINQIGVDSAIAMAKRLGVESDIPHEPGIALGSVDASLWEMVRVFATFANRGVRPELYYLTRVETADGQKLVEFQAPDPATFPRVLQQRQADMMIRLMQSVVDGGTGGRLRYISNFIYPAAGKTGTSNKNMDGWFIGYTPNIVTGAWVGAEQPAVHFLSTRLGQGGASALPEVGYFWKKIYDDPAFADYKKGRFPFLDSLASAEFNCPDFVPDTDALLDSLVTYLEMSPDSISDSLRTEKVLKFRRLLEINGYDWDQEETDEPGGNSQTAAEGEADEKGKRQGVRLTEEQRKESERIQKKNERLERRRERKKKLKNALDKIFGGGN